MKRSGGWLAIDPEPVYGDLARNPWPLLTQVCDDWTAVVPDPARLVHRAPARRQDRGVVRGRGVRHGLWAADGGSWMGFLGADRDLARAALGESG